MSLGVAQGAFTGSSFGQLSDRYHVIELLPLAERSFAIPYAINDDGLIVGVSFTTGDDDFLPTLWVPCEGGCCPPTWTAVNLMTIGSGGGLGGEARDINNAGRIAGWRRYDPSSVASGTRPYVWDIATPSNSTLLSDLSPNNNQGGRAWGINDLSPALVVGEALNGQSCFGNPANKIVHAFAWSTSDSPTLLTDLSAENDESSARAINTVTEWPTAAGYVGTCGTTSVCDSARDGFEWLLDPAGTVPMSVQEVVPLGASSAASVALSINNDVMAVGFQRYDPPGSQGLGETCFSKAAFWNGFNLTDLHQFTGLTAEKETVANAISEALGTCYRVVGESPDQDVAFRWTLSGGGWSVDAFDGLLDGFGDSWEIIRANGLNADQWVVGRAIKNGGPVRVPVVLVYRPCIVNFDGNGTVDAGDIAILLGAWGPSTSCGGPDAPDIDMDGDVDAADLATLLGFWGSSCADGCPEGDIAGSGMESSNAVQTVAGNLDSMLLSIGYADTSAFVNWAAGATPSEREGIAEYLAAIANGGSQ